MTRLPLVGGIKNILSMEPWLTPRGGKAFFFGRIQGILRDHYPQTGILMKTNVSWKFRRVSFPSRLFFNWVGLHFLWVFTHFLWLFTHKDADGITIFAA